MNQRAEVVAVGVVETLTLTKRCAVTGRIDEVIESRGDGPSRVLLRRPGAAAESYARLENVMVAMRMLTGGNTGAVVYEAGEELEIDIDHAKRVFLLAHGDVLDEIGGRALTPLKAAAALGLRRDDIVTAAAPRRKALAKYKGV